MSAYLQLNAHQQLELMQKGKLSPVDLIDATLNRIALVQPVLNPFCFVFEEPAREQARQAERLYKSSPIEALPMLLGLPVAIKDFTPTCGQRTTLGSLTHEHWIPEYDAEIVKRLKAAGAIIIGKTTTPEFAWSSFTRSRLWGETLNPWHSEYTPGGSSGGSAVAVTTGCASLAEGTDMGGSVRIPAALCGIIGHKPSLGRIPMDILDTTFDNISHFGPLARSVHDAALFMRAVEGPYDKDIQSQPHLNPIDAVADKNLEGVSIAISEDLGFYHVHDDVKHNLQRVTTALEDAGAKLLHVSLPWRPEVATAWTDLWAVYQAAAFGHLLPDWHEQMDPGLVRLIRHGQDMSAVEYRQLDTIRTKQWHALSSVLDKADCLLCPTMTQVAPPVTLDDASFESVDEQGRLHGLDMTAVFNNIAQCPVMSVPSGTNADGLPTAVQIVGRRFDDNFVFRIAQTIENLLPASNWTTGSLKIQ